MKIQTIIIMVSLIIIGSCLLKVALNKTTYEGFTNFINDENKLSFNQLEKKYTNKDCSPTPYDIGSYVEVYTGGETISQAILNPTDYDTNWKSAEVVSYVNGKYTVKYEDDTTNEVDEDLVKSHHQNECTISQCGIKDNKCAEDCNEANNIGGSCMPVQNGKDADNKDIKYQVCPRICRNDEKNIDELECAFDKCCKGCGFSVFQINDNDDGGVSQVMYRLKKIPYDSQSYEIDQTYDYATEMEKEAKRVSDAMDAASFSQTETEEAAINGGTETSETQASETEASETEGEPESEDIEPTASTEDASDDTSSNTVNAFVDHNNCWIGPTGNESFKYCGPAPFSF